MKIVLDIETGSLDSMQDPISCIGLINIETKEKKIWCGEDEEKILKSFWDYTKEDTDIITYNGESFDLPFIVRRCIVLGIKIKRFKSIDLIKIANSFFLSYNKAMSGTLREWAEVLGLEILTQEGKIMTKYFRQKKFKKIEEHNSEDLDITLALYERLVECNVITA